LLFFRATFPSRFRRQVVRLATESSNNPFVVFFFFFKKCLFGVAVPLRRHFVASVVPSSPPFMWPSACPTPSTMSLSVSVTRARPAGPEAVFPVFFFFAPPLHFQKPDKFLEAVSSFSYPSLSMVFLTVTLRCKATQLGRFSVSHFRTLRPGRHCPVGFPSASFFFFFLSVFQTSRFFRFWQLLSAPLPQASEHFY